MKHSIDSLKFTEKLETKLPQKIETNSKQQMFLQPQKGFVKLIL